MLIWAFETLPADRRISRRLPNLCLIALANSNLAMDLPLSYHTWRYPVDDRKDYGFGLAPCQGDFDAAWDVLEWKIWGPWESDGSGRSSE